MIYECDRGRLHIVVKDPPNAIFHEVKVEQ